jgi:hypothetical protein
MTDSIPTISLPQLSPMHPLVTFPLDRIKLRIKLTSLDDDISAIVAFDLKGHEVYRIDERHRYWCAALVIVGRMMADNPAIFCTGKFDG